jgi:hypothetical protein
MGKVEVADRNRVGIAERPRGHLGSGPRTDSGERSQTARRGIAWEVDAFF